MKYHSTASSADSASAATERIGNTLRHHRDRIRIRREESSELSQSSRPPMPPSASSSSSAASFRPPRPFRAVAFLVFALTAAVTLLVGDAESRWEASFLRSQRSLEETAEREADASSEEGRARREKVRVLAMRTGGGSVMGIDLGDEDEGEAATTNEGVAATAPRRSEGRLYERAQRIAATRRREGATLTMPPPKPADATPRGGAMLSQPRGRSPAAREASPEEEARAPSAVAGASTSADALGSRRESPPTLPEASARTVSRTVEMAHSEWRQKDAERSVQADRARETLSDAERQLKGGAAAAWNPVEPRTEEGWRALRRSGAEAEAEAGEDKEAEGGKDGKDLPAPPVLLASLASLN